MLVGVVSLLEGEDGGVEDPSLLFQRVRLRGERQNRLVVGGKAGESKLRQVVDEEVELGGDAAQTGLYQPMRGGDVEVKLSQRPPPQSFSTVLISDYSFSPHVSTLPSSGHLINCCY